MPTITEEQIDVAVPPVQLTPEQEAAYQAGQPRRFETNAALKAMRADIEALEDGKADATATSAALVAVTDAQAAQGEAIAGKLGISADPLPDAGAPTDKIMTVRTVGGVPVAFEQTRAQFETGTVKAAQRSGGGVSVSAFGQPIGIGDTLSGIRPAYRWASFGDSRQNFTGRSDAAVNGQGLVYLLNRSPYYTLAKRPDFEPCFNGALTGDTTSTVAAGSGWSNTARSQGKTFAALAAAMPDIVEVQYGINNYYAASNVVSNFDTYLTNTTSDLKALVLSLLALGAKVVYQETLHCTIAAYGTDAVRKWELTNAINAEMSTFVGSLPADQAVFVPLNQLLEGPDGYPLASMYADGVHANDAQARIVGFSTAEASKRLLPQRSGVFSSLAGAPNVIRQFPRLLAADTPLQVISGTYSGNVVTRGYDAALGRSYVDLSFNVTALASGAAQVILPVLAHVGSYGGGTANDFALAANDWVQGSGVIVCGENVASLDLRLRSYKQAGGSDFADVGDSGYAPVASYTAGEQLSLRVPRLQLLAGSDGIVEPPAYGTGLQLHLFVKSTSTGPGSIRFYSPAIRKVAAP